MFLTIYRIMTFKLNELRYDRWRPIFLLRNLKIFNSDADCRQNGSLQYYFFNLRILIRYMLAGKREIVEPSLFETKKIRLVLLNEFLGRH